MLEIAGTGAVARQPCESNAVCSRVADPEAVGKRTRRRGTKILAGHVMLAPDHVRDSCFVVVGCQRVAGSN